LAAGFNSIPSEIDQSDFNRNRMDWSVSCVVERAGEGAGEGGLLVGHHTPRTHTRHARRRDEASKGNGGWPAGHLSASSSSSSSSAFVSSVLRHALMKIPRQQQRPGLSLKGTYHHHIYQC
jgi:hypothetical protein